MRSTPSIVLEGTSRAADWIPFAKSMLEGMVSDGTSNSSPEEGITIVVQRHGLVSKIYIKAIDAPKKYFVGVPYDGVNIAGWGEPYDENNPQGTPGSTLHQEVLITLDGTAAVERFPEYAQDYPDIKYGNTSWISADGETLLSWDGNNTTHNFENTSTLIIQGACCIDNQPTNNWHKGYTYPGVTASQRIYCTPFENRSQRITAVDSYTPVSFQSEDMVSNKIYKDGEVLLTIKVALDAYTGVEETDVFVFGAAIQKVEEEDGSITEYLVAMVTGLALDTTTSQKDDKDYLYRTPLLDFNTYTLTRVSPNFNVGSSLGTISFSPWIFNSTGTEAVRVAEYSVIKINIDDQGGVTDTLVYNDADLEAIWKNSAFVSPLNPGDEDYWAKSGLRIKSVGYKNGVAHYGVEYRKAWARRKLALDDPGTGCDTLTDTKERHDQVWFAFTAEPISVHSASPGAMLIDTHHRIFEYDNVGGINGTLSAPARKYHTYKKRDVRHAIFIDSEHEIIVFEHTIVPANTHYYGQNVGDAAFLMDTLASPATYVCEIKVEMFIAGALVYESEAIRQIRRPGDCHETSRYAVFNEQFSCDQTGFLLYLSGNPDAQGDVYQSYDHWEQYNMFFFCNVQVQNDLVNEGEFDILFTTRSKLAVGTPSASFTAHWDGEGLINEVDIPELLGINNDGVYVNTGKI